MVEQDFICSDSFESSGIVEWNSPSNIALVKYWGKKQNQIPQNPSISFTLSKCYTNTVVEFKQKKILKIKYISHLMERKIKILKKK